MHVHKFVVLDVLQVPCPWPLEAVPRCLSWTNRQMKMLTFMCQSLTGGCMPNKM